MYVGVNRNMLREMLCFVLIVLGVAGCGLVGQEEAAGTPRFSLKEVQDYAVKHSVQTRNARLDVTMAKKKVWETAADGLPQIDASVSYQNYTQLPTSLLPAQIFDPTAPPGTFVELKFGTQHNAALDVTVSQLVFRGSYIVGLQAARIYRQLSRQNLEKSEIQIKETVTSTYYLILLAERTKEILEENIGNLQRTLYETKELYKAGFAQDTDVDQLQLSLTDLENQLKSAIIHIRISYKLLKYQMGFESEEGIILTDSLSDILNRIDAEALLSLHLELENHIDFRLASTQELGSLLTLRKERSAYLPSISAYFTHSRSAQRDDFNFFEKSDDRWFPSTVFGLSIKVPIFSSGLRAARVAQAKLELEKAKNTGAYVAEGLQLALMQARADFSNALEKTRSTEENVKLARRIYDKTLEKYRQGTATSLELTQTYNQYLTAESNCTAAVVELLNARIQLDKALNQL